MKYIYVKYSSNKRESIVKDNEGIICKSTEMSDVKLPSNTFKNVENSCRVIELSSKINRRIDTENDEITKFFFDSIHKNYMRNR